MLSSSKRLQLPNRFLPLSNQIKSALGPAGNRSLPPWAWCTTALTITPPCHAICKCIWKSEVFLKNLHFYALFSAKYCSENAGNRISKALDFKIFLGEHSPRPPRCSRLRRSVPPTVPIVTSHFRLMHRSEYRLDPPLLKSRIALKVARKIAPCDRAFSAWCCFESYLWTSNKYYNAFLIYLKWAFQ